MINIPDSGGGGGGGGEALFAFRNTNSGVFHHFLM